MPSSLQLKKTPVIFNPSSCAVHSPYYRVDLVVSGFKNGNCIVSGQVNSLVGCAVMSLLRPCLKCYDCCCRRYVVRDKLSPDAQSKDRTYRSITGAPVDDVDAGNTMESHFEDMTDDTDISDPQERGTFQDVPTYSHEISRAAFKSSHSSTPSLLTDPETGEQGKKKRNPHLVRVWNQSISSLPNSIANADDLSLTAPRISDFQNEEELMDSLFETATLRSLPIPEEFESVESLSSGHLSLYPPKWDKSKENKKLRRRSGQTSPAQIVSQAKNQIFLDNSNAQDEDFYLGKLKFSLAFDQKQRILTLKILQARDLMPEQVDDDKPSSLVKFYVIPGTLKYLAETSLVRETPNPSWNEVFMLEGFSRRRLKGRDLILKVMEKKLFGVGPYGFVKVPLTFLHYRLTRRSVSLWKFIRPEAQDVEGGNIQISLTLMPQEKVIIFGIHQAVDLRNTSVTSIVSPFVRILVKTKEDAVLFKKDTQTVQHSINPEWSEYIEMPLTKHNIDNIFVDLMVKDGGTKAIGHGNLMGRVRIGYGARGNGMRHWQYMRKNAKNEIYLWHQVLPRLIS